MVGVGADVLQGSGVPIVQVDADNFTTVVCGSALNVDIALALGAAVAAGAVDLAVVFGVEVDDLEKVLVRAGQLHWTSESTYIHSTTAIVLDNLVAGVVSTTANDPGLLSGRVSSLQKNQRSL